MTMFKFYLLECFWEFLIYNKGGIVIFVNIWKECLVEKLLRVFSEILGFIFFKKLEIGCSGFLMSY